jgi:transposase-like protein
VCTGGLDPAIGGAPPRPTRHRWVAHAVWAVQAGFLGRVVERCHPTLDTLDLGVATVPVGRATCVVAVVAVDALGVGVVERHTALHNIAEYGDETVILCTDQYSIYDGIDEYDEINGHLAINHDDHYVVSDAHTNSCENRHSFLRNWLRRFRGVSKHHLQGYPNVLGWILNTDVWFEQILHTDFYR